MSDKTSMSTVPTIDKILELAPKAVVSTAFAEEWLFNPAKKEYQRVADLVRHQQRNRSISNAEALLTVVLEEARRHENKTGDHMTVIFSESGGHFFTDDKNRINPDVWTFQRKNSKQLDALLGVIEKAMDHASLLRAMSTIRYIVNEYGQVYSAMRRVRINKNMRFESQPRIEDGKSGSEIQFTFHIEGEGAHKASFPSEFVCELPLISMSSVTYKVDVEIDSWTEDKALAFALRVPGLKAIRTKAVLDEIATFKDAASKALPELLIVTDL